MNPHSYNRSPSPGRPLQGYQLDDAPYGHQGHLEMPSSDRLADQPTVRDRDSKLPVILLLLTTAPTVVLRRKHRQLLWPQRHVRTPSRGDRKSTRLNSSHVAS